MYKIHFGLRENPFNMTPDPRYIYLSDQHEDALVQLLYGVNNRKGFLLVTGEIGTGKTTISRTLLERLDDNTETALILNPFLTEAELLKSIIEDFNIACYSDSIKDMVDSLNKFLLDLRGEGKNAVLIIDEAQNLPIKSMELIRMLSNLETNTEKLLQIVLIGQPELLDKLAEDNMRQLNQRITVRSKLGPLGTKDTKGYISHRLSKAGAFRANLFTSRAAREVFFYTKGYPRLINTLCDRALLCAYSYDKKNVDKKTVSNAAKDVLDTVKKKRRNNFYRCAFYTLALVFALYLAYPTIMEHYFKLVLVAKNATETGGTPSSPSSPEAAANNTVTASVAPEGDATRSAGTEKKRRFTVVDANVIEEAISEAVEASASGVETDAAVTKADVEKAAPVMYLDNDGRYLAHNLDFSLEVALVNLLSIWGEKSEVLELIGGFDQPSVTFEYILEKLNSYNISLKSEYNIVTGRISTKKLKRTVLPVIVALKDDSRVNFYNYVLITSFDKSSITIIDPVEGVTKISMSDFSRRYMNEAIVMYKSPFISDKPLRKNMVTGDVMILEASLKELGYFDAEPDSSFDELTYEAVVKLQTDNGLKADGKVGNVTKIALIKSMNKGLMVSSKRDAAEDE